MTFKMKNFSKAAFKDQIVRKQNQFNRFKRRCKVSKNPVEKSFLKMEAAQIVKDLKQFSKQWNSCGFGPCTWITRGFTGTSGFTTSTTRKSARKNSRKNSRKSTRKYGSKTTSRKRYGKRSYARRGNKVRSNVRRTRKSNMARRSSKMRRSYVAW